jgi:proteasome accessory factor B
VTKLERLLNLTAALLDTPRPLTAEEIRRRLPGYPEREDSFRRTFERDKDDLREMGIPIEVVEVPGSDPPVSGYRISPERYYLPDPGLEPDELAALQIAAVSIRLGDTDAELDLDAVRKLGGRPAGTAEAEEVAALPQPAQLADLFDAVANRREARFSYGQRPRTVRPLRLDYHRGHWYLSGYDTGRDADRRFRLDRIEGTVELGPAGAFERPVHVPGVMAEPWELGEGEPVSARLLVDADQVPLARMQLPADTPWEERGDGSAVATVGVVNTAAFRSFVLTFLDHVEVLEPPELRADVAGWLARLVEPVAP